MRDLVRPLARRSRTAIIIYKIFDNWRLRKRVDSGDIETVHGSTHSKQSISDSIAYIEKQFADYLSYANLSRDYLRDRRILELGPGDNLGVALKFLAAGAASVVCLDRFYYSRNTEHEMAIYQALRERLGDKEKDRFDEADDKLQTIYGKSLEEVAGAPEFGTFDLILSCAVLEEIYDLNPTFAAMDRLLAPGGALIHKIDLSDYGMFRDAGMHPLTFLTISEPVYKRMASDSGLPNRKRLGYYVGQMKELGYQSEFFVTSTIPTGRLEPAVKYVAGSFKNDSSGVLLDQIRNRLASDFRNLDEEELLIDGMLLVAQKPV
jgi:SAM-dependent methyltransferase